MNLTNALNFLLLMFLSSQLALGISPEGQQKNEIPALKTRGNLPNFFARSQKGDTIKVAYLGGSITAQNGWRVFSLQWFTQQFPRAVFSEINAAIGGTGSDFGVFRLHDHVLKFHPDLVFVEFAVNDAGASEEKIIRSTEGIVRQIWEHHPKTDICFVYTIMESFLGAAQKGELPKSALTMEKVAGHYNIPSINFGFKVGQMVSDHQLIFKNADKEINGVKVFSPDGVHPYPETGHAIYQQVLKQSFEIMGATNQTRPRKHRLPKPLATDYFSHTRMPGLHDVTLSKAWKILKIKDEPQFAGFGQYLSEIGKATKSGESLTVRFRGTAIGAYDIMGPDAGRVVVTIDDVVRDTISRFDSYCTYRRMNYFIIDHLENKDHTVVFTLLAEPFDKAAILQKRGGVIKNQEDYRENNWYIGKILIDGVLPGK